MSDAVFPPYNSGSSGGGGSVSSVGVSGVGPVIQVAPGVLVGRPVIPKGIVRMQDPDGVKGPPTPYTLQVGEMLLTEFYEMDCSAGNEIESSAVAEEGKDTFMYTKLAIWSASAVPTTLKLGLYTESGGNGVELLSPNLDLSKLIEKDDGVDARIRVFNIPHQVRRTAFIYARIVVPQAMRLNISVWGQVLSQFERY